MIDEYTGRGSPQTSDDGRAILSDPRLPPSSWKTDERASLLRKVAARGIAICMLPCVDEDRSEPGIDWDRGNWTPEAREVYEVTEGAVVKRYPTQKLAAVSAAAFSRGLVTLPALPWWRRLRGTLRWWWICARSLVRGSR